jgi:enterochelin esterase-like enzyme
MGLRCALVLHGYGASHRDAFDSLFLQDAQAQLIDGRLLPPLALAAVDGGNGYWHRHGQFDDPMAMLVHEFLPHLATMGLETGRVGVFGWSMGGYGALLFGELYPHRVTSVGAESPAIWPSYAAASSVNATAFDSAAQWRQYSVMRNIAILAHLPVRVDCGSSDPFLPASDQLRAALPSGEVHIAPGGHDATFWSAHAAAQIHFLVAHTPQ